MTDLRQPAPPRAIHQGPTLPTLHLPPAPDWMKQAACLESNPDVFFPDKSRPTAARTARQICGNCPVRNDCLAYALDYEAGIHGTHTSYPSGIYGGLDADQRRELVRERKAGA